MHSSIFYFIIVAILISPFECYHHYKSKLHRRQSQHLLQTRQQMPQSYNSFQPPIAQLPIAYPMYPSSFNGLPVGNAGFSYGNPYVPPVGNVNAPFGNVAVPFNSVGVPSGNNMMPADNDAVPSGKNSELSGRELGNAAEEIKTDNFSPFPESTLLDKTQPALLDFQTPVANYPETIPLMPSYSNSKPVNFGSKRRKKNIEENKDALMPSYSNSKPVNVGSKRRKKNIKENKDALMDFFEKGKKLLELSTINGPLSNKEPDNDLVENDGIQSNTTLIPLPKGIQLKTDSKSGDSIVHASANISGSTQKIIAFDNNTEIENVVEMQMEKKIEDEKGADKGFEQVRIVETERVKPMVKLNTSKVRRRKRKRLKHSHHRSKRSETTFDEVPKSKFLHNKMGHRFLTVVKRKERVVEPNNLMNRYMIPDFPVISQMTITENTKQTTDDSIYDEKEINDFMQFFLNEMKKFRKSQRNKKNVNEPLKKPCDDCNSFKFLPHKTRKLKKHLAYPEHMNVIMNLNMTWDPKTKEHVAKSVKISKAYRSENITAASIEVASGVKTMSPINVNEKQSTRFLTAVLFMSVVSCLLTFLALILPKLYNLIRLHRVDSAIKTYKIYNEYPRNTAKDTEREHLFAGDSEQLEWQSESGDWLSEKESQFK